MDNFFVNHSYTILALPLLSFVVNGLYLGRKNWKAAAGFAIVCVGLALVFTAGVVSAYASNVLGNSAEFPHQTVIAWEYNWLQFNSALFGGYDLAASIGMYLDPISVMMLVVICSIALLVNIYSVGYMKEDPSAGRFFALLSLFVFSMLGLVVAPNIFQMFVFWELVGVSSYLLIGFWYTKPSAVAASKKAFIVTRFADAFFLMGIIIVSYYTKSLNFLDLNNPENFAALKGTVSFGFFSVNLLTLATLLIFTGGWGKSAMFPLHIWLPDAMEGPTPVSSIIHSATMVVAGVFLTARMFPLFAASEMTLHIIEVIGAFTALFAAVIACTQTDIKRILAFSTLSQLGYMLFSLGTAKLAHAHHGVDVNILGYSASMFHIFTHAFFKCMLFLMAGQVIHVVHSNDIWKMGGLRKKMPFTYFSALIACLAIAGIPPFAGFFSKDEIILASLQSGHYLTAIVGLAVGGLTAFYMFRLFILTFHGKARSEYHHIHEDKWMTSPIVILTIPSIIAGIAFKKLFTGSVLPAMNIPETHFAHPIWLPILAGSLGAIGVLVAILMYGKSEKMALANGLRKSMGGLYTTVQNKFYIDEVYLFVTHKIIFKFVAGPIKWFDRNIVDGAMNLTAKILDILGIIVRLLQIGQLQFYLSIMILGLVFIYYIGRFVG